MKRVSVLITDLDNTLFDWLEMWHRTFSAMLERLVAESGLPQEVLETEIRRVFQKYGTSEYAFVIQEIPSLQRLHPGEDLTQRYQSAIAAFRAAREASLRLYPGVKESLQTIRDAGSLVVAYTESLAYYSMWRVKFLGLDGLIDYLYSPPDHPVPDLPPEQLRPSAPTEYSLACTVHRFIPAGELKPNPHVLRAIIAGVGSKPEDCIYVGDSLMKDIAMAQDAGVLDVYAEYGEARDSAAYDLLRRVSHWTEADVQREKAIQERGEVRPSVVLHSGFGQIHDYFQFVPFTPLQALNSSVRTIPS